MTKPAQKMTPADWMNLFGIFSIFSGVLFWNGVGFPTKLVLFGLYFHFIANLRSHD